MGLVFTPIFLLKIKCCNATRQHPFPVTTKTWVLKQQASLADAMTFQPIRVMMTNIRAHALNTWMWMKWWVMSSNWLTNWLCNDHWSLLRQLWLISNKDTDKRDNKSIENTSQWMISPSNLCRREKIAGGGCCCVVDLLGEGGFSVTLLCPDSCCVWVEINH